ncbi:MULTISPECIES: hypothetical protein [unclassified Paenibacillus]|uniref:hypothetical protein n=1 Tax=unclassified Paenibacillus TaxID=185978 RepID=UPI0008CDAAAC|nr:MULTISPECIES: hypothetical protein [unclassified Paenibacillus]SEK74561.1 hypothetical protein SAMN05518856_104182 [Paenibacillus sp. OK003]SLK19847.1 hypothetical protein SAMN06272722_1156 [Paenibacillus sp. RU5A]SOC75939.1 hypothetical protein SAMN05880581_1156 [Paenibacillus sp. RU26A]SOC77717.1 hypothetical protein SAMN05880586_1156 [Paenibacillus sp. RU5M]
MDRIRNYLFVFAGNFVAAYMIFPERTIGKSVMFASLMLLLSMGMDFMKSKNQHSLEQQ